MKSHEFVYTTYIKTTPQKIWDAITKPEFTRQYWGFANVSDWKKNSKWEHYNEKEKTAMVTGKVLETKKPKRLVISWASPADLSDVSRVTFEIEKIKDMVKLVVVHDRLKAGSVMASKISMGWPLVLSAMKTFLETKKPVDIWSYKKACK